MSDADDDKDRQIPLLEDIVFDPSLPLKPPPKPKAKKPAAKNFSKDYDPDTLDLFGDTLENVVALASVAALDSWRDAPIPGSGDLRHFLHIAEALELDREVVAGRRVVDPFDRYYDIGQEAVVAGDGVLEDVTVAFIHPPVRDEIRTKRGRPHVSSPTT